MSVFTKLLDAATDLFPPAVAAKKLIKALAGGDSNKEAELEGYAPQIQEAIIARDMARDAQIEKSFQVQLETTARVIESDNAQGDKYTKRMRPSVVYGGGLMFVIEFLVKMVFDSVTGEPPYDGTMVPEPVIYSWSGITSIYFGGRTVEKVKEIRSRNKETEEKPKLLQLLMG